MQQRAPMIQRWRAVARCGVGVSIRSSSMASSSPALIRWSLPSALCCLLDSPTLIPWLLLFQPAGRPVAGASQGPRANSTQRQAGGRHHSGFRGRAGRQRQVAADRGTRSTPGPVPQQCSKGTDATREQRSKQAGISNRTPTACEIGPQMDLRAPQPVGSLLGSAAAQAYSDGWRVRRGWRVWREKKNTVLAKDL